MLFSLVSTWFRICELRCSGSNYTSWFLHIPNDYPLPTHFYALRSWHFIGRKLFLLVYVFSLCLSGSCLTTCIIVEIFSKITPTTTTTQMAICGSVIFCPTTTVVFPGRPINTVNVQNCWPTRDILIFALYTRLHTPFSFRVWSALIATLGSTRRHWQLKN